MSNDKESGFRTKLSAEDEHEMIKTAPILDVAAYFRGNLELAVQLRVDIAVEDTYDKIAARQGVIAQDMYKKWAMELEQPEMEVTARPLEPKGNLCGFASVKIGGIRIDDFKIVTDKDNKLFVGMPSKPDKKSESGYRNIVYIDKDFREEFGKKVLAAHHDAVEILKKRAGKMFPLQEKSERIADQIDKAGKKAITHNAAFDESVKKKK